MDTWVCDWWADHPHRAIIGWDICKAKDSRDAYKQLCCTDCEISTSECGGPKPVEGV